MKRIKKAMIISLSMVMMAGVCSITQNIYAQEVQSDVEQIVNDENDKRITVTVENTEKVNDAYMIDEDKFDLQLDFLENADITNYTAKLEESNHSGIISNTSVTLPLTSTDTITKSAIVKDIKVESEGKTDVNVSIIDGEGKIVCEDLIKLDVNFGELYVSEDVLNLSTNNLIYYIDGHINPGKSGDMKIGFLRKDGSIFHPLNAIKITTSDRKIVNAGSIFEWNTENLLSYERDKEYYPKLIKYWTELKESSASDYITGQEYMEIIKEFYRLNNLPYGGGGYVTASGFAIIPREPGTAYLTVKSKYSTKTIKVNVSNLSSTPVEQIPRGFENEFLNEKNQSVTIALKKPDIVKANVFDMAMKTEKSTVFTIVDEDNKLLYSWSFEKGAIKYKDIDLDLEILFTSDKEKEIKDLISQEGILPISFKHHGNLPGTAKVTLDINKYFADGETLYLNYYDDEKGKVIPLEGKHIVKNGLVDIDIDHCSTYFFTKSPIDTDKSTDKDITNENNDNKTLDTSSKENKSKENASSNDTKKSNNTEKKVQNNVNTGDTTMPIAYTLLVFVSFGIIVVLNKKRKYKR